MIRGSGAHRQEGNVSRNTSQINGHLSWMESGWCEGRMIYKDMCEKYARIKETGDNKDRGRIQLVGRNWAERFSSMPNIWQFKTSKPILMAFLPSIVLSFSHLITLLSIGMDFLKKYKNVSKKEWTLGDKSKGEYQYPSYKKGQRDHQCSRTWYNSSCLGITVSALQ